jgi:hypothetical protein
VTEKQEWRNDDVSETPKVLLEDGSPEQKAQDAKDDAERKAILSKVTDTNKRLDDIYDEKLREIEAERKMLPKDEKEVEIHKAKVQALQEEYLGLKAKISASRRSGQDPIIAEFKSRTIPSKIMLFKATKEQRDFDEVRTAIKECLTELEEANKEEILNVKKEIQKRYEEEMQKMRDAVPKPQAKPASPKQADQAAPNLQQTTQPAPTPQQ